MGKRREDQQVQHGRGQQSAQHSHRHGTFDLLARTIHAHRERCETERGYRGGHENRNQALVGASNDHVETPDSPFDFDQVLIVGKLTPNTVTKPTTVPREIPIPVTAIASTLPIKLKGRFAKTSQLLARQWNETKRIITINPSASTEYMKSWVRVSDSACAAPLNSIKTPGGSFNDRAIAC
jgi:hypothetical protein